MKAQITLKRSHGTCGYVAVGDASIAAVLDVRNTYCMPERAAYIGKLKPNTQKEQPLLYVGHDEVEDIISHSLILGYSLKFS